MERCLPKCLGISSMGKVHPLIVVVIGIVFIWLGFEGFKTSPTPVSSPGILTTTSTSSADLKFDGERVLVTEVIDGDTIEIFGGDKVRYLGLDTPETKDPRKPVECFGKEAANENKKLVEGKEVILQKDISNTDKYNRLLRYVFLPLENGQLLFVNDYLIRQGYAYVLTYPPDVKYNEKFLEAQTDAKINTRGLWSGC